jgi:hypothetical protein
MPASSASHSTAIWLMVPWPGVPKASLPGSALAFSITSLTDVTPLAGWVSSKSGAVAMRVTGIRSLYGS